MTDDYESSMSNVDVDKEYDQSRVSGKSWQFWAVWVLLGLVLFVPTVPGYTSVAGMGGGLAAVFAVSYGITWAGARLLTS